MVGNFELIVDEQSGFRFGAETSAVLLGSPSPDAAGQKPRGPRSIRIGEGMMSNVRGQSQVEKWFNFERVFATCGECFDHSAGLPSVENLEETSPLTTE